MSGEKRSEDDVGDSSQHLLRESAVSIERATPFAWRRAASVTAAIFDTPRDTHDIY